MGRLSGLRIAFKILWRKRRALKQAVLIDVVFAGGVLMVAGGCGWIYGPSGLIVGGFAFAGLAWRYEPAPPPAELSARERELIGHFRELED